MSDSCSNGIDWGRERAKVLDVLCSLVECDLWLLWEPASVHIMEDFSKSVCVVTFSYLSNSN